MNNRRKLSPTIMPFDVKCVLLCFMNSEMYFLWRRLELYVVGTRACTRCSLLFNLAAGSI
jgi:hypothetical protein